MGNKLLESALTYAQKYRWSVIPLSPGSKIPPKGFSPIPYRDRIATEAEIMAWWKENPKYNVGIVTGKLSNLFVVDHDKHKPDYSEDAALKLIPDSTMTPTSRTPNGGEHQYFSFPQDANVTIGASIIPSVDFRGEGGYIVAPPSINGNGHGYSWLIPPDDAPLAPPPSHLLKVLKDSMVLNKDKYKIYIHGDDNSSHLLSSLSSDVINLFNQGTRDQDLFHVANLLVKAGCEQHYLVKVLEMLALNCNPPFPINEAKEKILSAVQRAQRRDSNLTADIREWVLSSSGIFLSSDVAKCHHLSSRSELQNLSNILNRLRDEGLIEKYGNKRGQFRTIDQDEEEIDFLSADTTPINLRLPLNIHEWVAIHPGNIIVVAGESNAGKTAFLLNVAKLNCSAFHTKYLSSEMQNGAELRIRLDRFGDRIEIWKQIRFVFRTDNFPDKIEPDGLNIIDYLDEGTDAEAYKMPMRIRQIADRLKKGVAVIAIQKDPNKGLGFGGSGTMNRSRLYLTLSRQGIIKIEKGKIWRNENINPNGLFARFKLVGGAKFIRESEWQQ